MMREDPAAYGVEEGDVVFDVGAWIGDTAYVFSKKACGGGRRQDICF